MRGRRHVAVRWKAMTGWPTVSCQCYQLCFFFILKINLITKLENGCYGPNLNFKQDYRVVIYSVSWSKLRNQWRHLKRRLATVSSADDVLENPRVCLGISVLKKLNWPIREILGSQSPPVKSNFSLCGSSLEEISKIRVASAEWRRMTKEQSDVGVLFSQPSSFRGKEAPLIERLHFSVVN